MTSNEPLVATSLKLVRDLREAGRRGGRAPLVLALEMLGLRIGRHRLRFEEYLDYRLFRPELTWAQKKRFVGSWIKDRVYRVQDPETARLGSDKLRLYQHLGELGFPHPRLLAATFPSIEIAGVAALRSSAAVADWLRDAVYPVFMKPAVSYRGFGNKLITAIDRGSDSLVYRDGVREPIAALAGRLGAPGAATMLFQQMIALHPAIATLTGDRVATARILVLNDSTEPEIFRAGFRIPVGDSMVDNFRGGKTSNLLARLDLETGRVIDVLAGIGLDWQTVDRHPDTGVRFAAFTIPDWQAARALVIAASRAMPGLLIHHWDVAFTGSGPVLLETNPRGDFGIPQITTERGLADDRFLRLYGNGRI